MKQEPIHTVTHIKYTLAIYLSLVSLKSNGQETHDGCGIDKDPKLNQCELEFFDSFFGAEIFNKKSYDFRDKKFASDHVMFRQNADNSRTANLFINFAIDINKL